MGFEDNPADEYPHGECRHEINQQRLLITSWERRAGELAVELEEKTKLASDVAHTLFRLQNAVRKHRDQRGDDRCWMDDEDLYRALPEGYEPPERDTAVELKNCERFICNRRNPNTVYESPEREVETLKANLSHATVVETALRCSRRIQDREFSIALDLLFQLVYQKQDVQEDALAFLAKCLRIPATGT